MHNVKRLNSWEISIWEIHPGNKITKIKIKGKRTVKVKRLSINNVFNLCH